MKAGTQVWTTWFKPKGGARTEAQSLQDHTTAASQEPEAWKVVCVLSERNVWIVLLEAIAEEQWVCEECKNPWKHGRQTCSWCGNRTRVPL